MPEFIVTTVELSGQLAEYIGCRDGPLYAFGIG
jgi:hypothetical protein